MQNKDVLGNVIAASENKLKVKLLREDAVLPTRGTADAAGLDLYAVEDYDLLESTATAIHTGVAVEIPKGYVGLLFVRSGLATKKHLRPSNCVGVIDSDYRGEVILSCFNDNLHIEADVEGNIIHTALEKISRGDRIAQLVIVPCMMRDVVQVDELSETARGEGGFGSTGK
jgi:dUTP pyrophosphatase